MMLKILVTEACNLLLSVSASKNKRPTGNCYLCFSDLKYYIELNLKLDTSCA
jgi:hypothetical protein